MNGRGGNSIVVVGGGASGVILAAHLLDNPDPALRVTLIERQPAFGRGLAYSTDLPDHLLNVSAIGMSAFAGDPEHFRRWLEGEGLAREEDAPVYAPRRVYGRYLAAVLDDLAARERSRLRLVREECVAVTPRPGGVEARLGNGASIVGHVAVLAAGHDEAPAPDQDFAMRLGSAADGPLDPDARVLILGTGLSMVDVWLTLDHRGHRGQVVALSRRGLLPSPHKKGRPIRLDSADIPLGTELSYFVGWFRDLVRETERAGGDWRDAVDGLRPFNQRIWDSWPAGAKRRFLEHSKAWWDIHRHRMAPQIHEKVDEAVRAGRLRPLAGRIVGVEGEGNRRAVRVQPRHSGEPETLDVARVYDCTGIVRDVSAGSIAVVRSLIDRGLARPDPLRVGLDVSRGCAVLDAAGAHSERLFAVGPLTRGTFFEIDAVADIRLQCAGLARFLTARRKGPAAA